MFLHLECKNNNGTYLIDNCPQSPAVVCQGWDHVVCRTACLGLRQGPMLTGENFKMVRPSEGLLLLSPLFPSPHLRPAPSPCRGCSVSPQPLPPLLPFREPTLSAGSVNAVLLQGSRWAGAKDNWVKFPSVVGNAPRPGTSLSSPPSLRTGIRRRPHPLTVDRGRPRPGAAPGSDGWYRYNQPGQSLRCRKICEYIWCAPGVYLG